MVGWENKPLLECVDLLQGLTYSPSNVKSYGTLVLRSSNIKNGKLDFNDCVYVDCNIDENKFVKPNDILICVRNGSSALIGKSCVIDKPYNATFGAFMSVLRGDTTGYVAHFFASDIVQSQIRNRSSATINQITKRDFEDIVITIPIETSEQRRIAEALSDMDSYVVSLEKLIAKKRAIKQGTMQELLTGRRRLEGFSGEWVEIPLKEIAEDIIMGQSPDSRYYNNARIGLPLVQGNADVEDRLTIIRFFTSMITKRGRKGDIIMTVRAPVGSVARADFDCCLGRGVCAIKGNDFLFQLLIYFEPQWGAMSTGSTFDSISGNELREVMFTVPMNKDEQNAIARILSDMDAEIDTLTDKLIKLKNIKQGMMSELLTGRIRLKEDAQSGKN
jgi:type I restriction enzyme, S subunit